MSDVAVFGVVRDILVERTGTGLTQAEVDRLNAALHPVTSGPLTAKICLEIVGHEAIVQETYKDSKNIWTWSVGITSASGVNVQAFIDKPQALDYCISEYINLLKGEYLPDVVAAFKGRVLTENQLAAALSFHYNTGAIKTTSWVKLFMEGKPDEAKQFLETHYLNNGTLTKRRKAESDLFFSNKWSQTGKATVYPVLKPSYQPNWKGATQVDITVAVASALRG